MNPGAEREIRSPSPPIAGPIVNPMPKAAPIKAIPRARSSRDVTSAMYADAVEIVPPKVPARRRDAKSTASGSLVIGAMPKSV